VTYLEDRTTPAGLWHVTVATDTLGPLVIPGELRTAINNAATDFAANGGLETIDFKNPNNNNVVLNGNILLAGPLPDINFTFLIDGSGTGPPAGNTVTVSGGNGFRVFNVLNTGTISGLNLSGGDVSGNAAADNAGGVIRTLGVFILTLSKDSISGGTAVPGGGIAIKDGNLIVDQCQISNNTAKALGGGIYDATGQTTVTITKSVIKDNTAKDPAGIAVSKGGGLYSWATATIDQTTFANNTAELGGGMYLTIGRTTTITNSTIGDMNTATNDTGLGGEGGGIYIDSPMTVNLTNSTVADNYAVDGGGIYVAFDGKLNSKSATIAWNTAQGSGGGVYIDDGATVCTVNSAFVQNTANAGSDVFGAVTTFGCNLVEHSAGSSGFDWFNWGDILDPLGGTFFSPLAFNGGPTKTCLPDFWAIDNGDNAFTPGPTDQRGLVRIRGGIIDVGAVEIQPVNPDG